LPAPSMPEKLMRIGRASFMAELFPYRWLTMVR